MKKSSAEIIDLADRLHSAAIHLLRQVRVEDRSFGIGPAQLSALSVLVFGGSMSLGRLAAAEQVKAPTMVRIVQSLAQQKLVNTRADENDGRRVEIAATAAGRKLMMQARRKRVEALARAIGGLRRTEQAALSNAVAVLRNLRVSTRE